MITKRCCLWLIVVLLLFTPAKLPAGDKASSPLKVGGRTCLFLDDFVLAEQAGLKRTWHQGKPHAQAVLAEVEPWEHWILLHGGCFYDPKYKVYRMYYQSSHQPSGAPGVSFLDLICYAESKDGKTWARPKLGLVEFKGSKDNNVLMDFAGPSNVFIDPKATDPAGRLKMLTYILKGKEATKGQHGLCWFQSEDGVHWKYTGPVTVPGFANPEEGGFNDLFIVTWDDVKQHYLGNFRTFSKHKIGNIGKDRRRAIGLTVSNDLRKWTPVVNVIKPDDLDDRKAAEFGKDPKAPDWAELYIMPSFAYGNHHLGLVTLFCMVDAKDQNGGGDLQFCFSNDGVKWHRQPQRQTAVAPSGEEGMFPVFAQFTPPLEIGDELWIYYNESNGVHGILPFQKSKGKIRAAVWRKDGFVSLDAAAEATLTTKPLLFDGKDLRVNFDTGAGGSLRVALLDEAGKSLPGFGVDDCEPLTGDAVARSVTWKGSPDLGQHRNRPVRVRFEITKGRLWGFRFQP